MGSWKCAFDDHNIRMVFGDLNFWINCTYEEGVLTADWFEKEDMDFLQERD